MRSLGIRIVIMLIFLVSSTSLTIFGCSYNSNVVRSEQLIVELKQENLALRAEIENGRKKLIELENNIVQLENEINTLNDKIHAIENSPQELYAKAKQLLENGEIKNAYYVFFKISEQYPTSQLAELSKNEIKKLSKTIRKIEKEEKIAQLKKEKKPPLEPVTGNIVVNSANVRNIYCIWKNISDKTIDAYEVIILCYDSYNRPVWHYLYKSNRFTGQMQGLIKPGENSSASSYWYMHGFELLSNAKIKIKSVHFSDGSVWKPSPGNPAPNMKVHTGN